MKAGNRIALLTGSIGVIGVLVALAFVSTLPPSRMISIAELRAGVDFMLGDVRIHETGFHEYPPDGGYAVAFRVTFADGAREDVAFQFDGFCPFGATSEAVTVHRAPSAAFRHVCGDDSIRVSIGA